MTELLLPAGGLQAGLAAFEGGADAVYLGFSRFSARKEAKNFSFEEFAKLTSYARDHKKKIIVAINTLVGDDDLDQVLPLIRRAAFLGCDGVIVQDLGVASIIHDQFPTLKLHASTQMAVHTVQGVKMMEQLGFEQVVLSRELTLEEIRTIRNECPSIKLEVFIHGAMCYGFSGLCMASEKFCGRSANGGACAQICRSWFQISKDELKPAELTPQPINRSGWWLSMSDLDGTKAVKELVEMGIDSLKVEGRMKGPAYTLAAARYYRALLDGEEAAHTEELRKELQTVFARRQTGGWLADYGRDGQDFTERKAPTLGSTSFPRHRGLKIGTVREIRNGMPVLTLQEPLALRDGIQYFVASEEEPIGVVQYGLGQMFDAYNHFAPEAQNGMTVAIAIPEGATPPVVGQELFVISRHDQTLPIMGKDLKPEKVNLDTEITLEEGKITIETRLDYRGKRVRKIYPLVMERAQKPRSLEETLHEIFQESDQSFFSLGRFSVSNRTGLPDDGIFLPLSKIKAVRRDWYATMDQLLTSWLDAPYDRPAPKPHQAEILPERNLLSTSRAIPWLDIHELADLEKPEERMYKVMGRFYCPLPPVTFTEEALWQDLETVVKKLQDDDALSSVRFGLNNVSQIRWAQAHPSCMVFADIYMYLSNAAAASLLSSLLPENLTGGYLWLETQSFHQAEWPFTPSVVNPSFNIPLFISRSCFRHDSLLLSCEHCPRQGSWYISQQDRKLHVMVKDCMTVITQA
jgi:putative protease